MRSMRSRKNQDLYGARLIFERAIRDFGHEGGLTLFNSIVRPYIKLVPRRITRSIWPTAPLPSRRTAWLSMPQASWAAISPTSKTKSPRVSSRGIESLHRIRLAPGDELFQGEAAMAEVHLGLFGELTEGARVTLGTKSGS